MARQTVLRSGNAVDAYAAHAEAVDHLLDRLKLWLLTLAPNPDGELIHWGHVGDMAEIRRRLEAVEAFALAEER